MLAKKACELYQKGMSAREIAHQLGYSKSTISSLVAEFGTPRNKGPRGCVFERKVKKCPDFSEKFRNYFDGLMISDGSLNRPNGLSAGTAYTQSCVNREWLEEISKVFLENGIEGVIGCYPRKVERRTEWVYRTKSYDKLLPQYCRWYGVEGKRVPQDVDFGDASFLKNWVYGDGTLQGGSSWQLCCESFYDQIDQMIEKLNSCWPAKFGKKRMGVSKGGREKFRIVLNKGGRLADVMGILGEPLECFKYKWAISYPSGLQGSLEGEKM